MSFILALILSFVMTASAHATLFFDTDLESCTAVSGLLGGGTGFPCTSNGVTFNQFNVGDPPHMYITNAKAFSGSKSIKLIYDNINGSSQTPTASVHVGSIFGGNRRHPSMRYVLWHDCPFAVGSNNQSKRVRFRAQSASNGSINAYPIFWTYNVGGNWSIIMEGPYDNGVKTLTGPPVRCNNWDQVEMEVSINTPGVSDGFVKLYVNNQLVGQTLNRQLVGPNVNSVNTALGLPAGGGNPSDWQVETMEIFLQSGNGTIYYDRIAYGDTRVGPTTGTPQQPQDTTPPSAPTNVTVN